MDFIRNLMTNISATIMDTTVRISNMEPKVDAIDET